MSQPETLLLSESLRLERLNPDHIFDVFSLIDSNREYLNQFGYLIAHEYPSIQSVHDSVRYPKNPLRERFAIVADETIVGSIDAEPAPQDSAFIMKYWIGKPHIGNGYATSAARGLSDNILARPDIEHVDAQIHRQDRVNLSVLMAAGFVCISHTLKTFSLRKTNTVSIIPE